MKEPEIYTVLQFNRDVRDLMEDARFKSFSDRLKVARIMLESKNFSFHREYWICPVCNSDLDKYGICNVCREPRFESKYKPKDG